jgi:hypothetical protein
MLECLVINNPAAKVQAVCAHLQGIMGTIPKRAKYKAIQVQAYGVCCIVIHKGRAISVLINDSLYVSIRCIS